MKINYGKLSVFFISFIFVLTACTNANNGEVSITPPPTPLVEIIDTKLQENKEEMVDDEAKEPATYLQSALEQLKTVETLSYMSSVNDSYYSNLNKDNVYQSMRIEHFSMDGELRRSPAAAKIDAELRVKILEYDEEGNNTVDDNYLYEYLNYIVAGEGNYSQTQGTDEWHQYYLSNDFRTIEHIEELVNLFLLYPEQLSFTEGEIQDGYDPDSVVIEYKLTNEQFVNLSADFRQSLFAGVYDLTDIDYDGPKVDNLESLYLHISLDKNYNILGYMINYVEKYELNDNPEDIHDYTVSASFYGFNESFLGEIPAEVRESAIKH